MLWFLLKGILSLPFNQCSLSQKTCSEQKLDETTWFSSAAVDFTIHLARSQYFFPGCTCQGTLWLLIYVILKRTTVYLLLLLSHFCCVWLCATLWTVAGQSPLSMGFSKQEYWVGCMPSSRGSSWQRDPTCRFFTTSTTTTDYQLSPKSFWSSHSVAILVLLSLIKIMSTLPLSVNCHNLASAILNHYSGY